MIITKEQLLSNYMMKSKLRYDMPHIFSIPYWCISIWFDRMDEVAERLVHAGLAKVCERSKKTGKIISLWSTDLQPKHLEQVCLSETDIARIDGWLKKGLYAST